jgi:hypothetical protein
MMVSRIHWGDFALLAAVLALTLLASPSAHAGNLLRGRAVGGITVDARGVVTQITPQERAEFVRRMRQDTAKAAAAMNLPVELRKVSLRGLEAALAEALANDSEDVPDEVRYLAGLQRIQYILVYPELNDIVLAGPGEGWKVDEQGNVVGVTTGRPVLRFDDLLIAFRTVEAARTEGISVSIDPTAEGRRKFREYMGRQTIFNPGVIKGIAEALGPQQVTYTGVPADSHFARVLVAADHRMKQLAMKLENAPIRGLPSYLDMLKSRRQLPGSAMPRWWMACNYEPVARSEDKLAWEIRGPGVKAMTEDEIIAADGTTQATGRQDAVAKQWSDLLTEKYVELAKKDAIMAELQSIMDMCVVAALVEKEDLSGLAGGPGFPLLTNPDSEFKTESWFAPQSISTQCSYLRIGRNNVITASGGVQVESWAVASRQEVDPKIEAIRAAAADSAADGWWWN